jgi:excisionase family DNA binding protein
MQGGALGAATGQGGGTMAIQNLVSDQVQREGLRVEEAAHFLGCGRTTVFQLIREGKLRVVKVGARTIVPRSEVSRFLAGATEHGGDAA